MEKIKKFEDCKIANLNSVTGGDRRIKKATIYEPTGNPDKEVSGDNIYKFVTNTHTWFNRDYLSDPRN